MTRQPPPPHADSVVIAATPEQVYDVVSDVTRTGEWSPICTACWWDEGSSGQVGDWFTGRNETPERTWETRSQVVTADRGREFEFRVGGSLVSWRYTSRAVDGGAELVERWEMLPAGVTVFEERYGEDADREIEERTAAAHHGIPATLAVIKEIVERA